MLMWTPGIGELAIIFLIVLLLFGGKKLPSLAKSIGAGINEFKKGLSGKDLDENEETPVQEKKSISDDSGSSKNKSKTNKSKKA